MQKTEKTPVQCNLTEIVRAMGASAYDCTTSRILKKNADVCNGLSSALEDMGFRHLELLNTGSSAMAFQTTDNQVLRITTAIMRGNPRPDHPLILPAIEKHEIKVGDRMFYLEILPKVDVKVEKHHIRKLKQALLDCNLYVRDIETLGNVALIKVGGCEVPVLLDSEHVSIVDPLKPILFDGNHLESWLALDGTWLVNQFDPRTSATGLIDREALARYEKMMTANGDVSDSQTVASIRENGFYSEDIHNLYIRAAERLYKEPKANYRDVMRQEREAMVQERKNKQR